MKIKNILLSSDDNTKYISFWPTAAYHWQSLGYNVYLALLTNKPDNCEFINKIKEHGTNVFVFKPSEKYNLMIQSKLLRYYISKFFFDDICCIHDIDFYTLDNHKHAEDMVTDEILNNNKIATLGYNAYLNYHGFNIENVKKNQVYRVPATPLISKGINIYSIFNNSQNCDFNIFLDNLNIYYQNLKKENSDESILYYFMSKNIDWAKNNIIFNVRNDFKDSNGNWCMYANKRIDRGKKCHFDMTKFKNGYYIDLCPSRPYDKNEIEYLLDYLKIPKELQNL